jgi:dipeptidyl aminopeptidase/acylaminoacyl peptidase
VYLSGKDEEAPWFSTSKKFDLFHLNLATQTTVKLTSNAGTNLNPRFSPDGKWIAYKSTTRLGTHNDVAQVMLLSTESGETKCLTPNFKYSPDVLAQQSWSSDSRSVYFSTAVGGDNQLWRADIDGKLTRLAEEISFAIFLGTSGERIVIQAASPARSPNLYAGSVQKLEPITDFNAELAARAPYEYQLARWSHKDGTAVEGIFFRPKNARSPSPCVVIPHGGPHVRTPAVLTPDALMFIDAGYAVFLPNYRGSSGYGQEFIDADRGDWGGKDFEDIMAGVDHLIAKGQIDADRLVIWGPSYGGFMTAWAIGQTTRFKAAVVFNGIVNLLSWHGQTDYKAATEWEFSGSPWDNVAKLMQHSPVAHASKVKTPTLIVYTDGDRRVPNAQGYELYTALKQRDVETEFLKYYGENHALNQPRHRQDYFRRVLSWFQKHCK